MSRSVDEVKHIVLSLVLVFHLYGVALNGDAALFLQVHIVEHLPACNLNGFGKFQHTVGQSRLPVVDVCDDAEVSYMVHSWKRRFIFNGKVKYFNWDFIAYAYNFGK